MNRFMYGPDDHVDVVGEADLASMGILPITAQKVPTTEQREAVRRQLGRSAEDMSDADLDRIISAVTSSGGQRTDSTGPVVKVGGHAANGKGYNPYRASGRFASGPHKEREKIGRDRTSAEAPAKAKKTRSAGPRKTPARVKFDDSQHKDVISAHRTIEAFHRTRSLKIAEQQKQVRDRAKALPVSDKKGRAELKFQHQELAKQRTEHKTSAAKARGDRLAESKAMHEARKQHAVAQATGKASVIAAEPHVKSPAAPVPKPAAAPITGTPGPAGTPAGAAIANREKSRGEVFRGISEHADGSFTIDKGAQIAMRESLAGTATAYGMHYRTEGTSHAKAVEIKTVDEMGGAWGQHWNENTNKPGLMSVADHEMAWVKHHSTRDTASMQELGRSAMHGDERALTEVFAAHIMNHETTHGFGPLIEHDAHRSTVEEFTTEIASRRITADMHGMPSHHVAVSEAYEHILNPIIDRTAQAAGVSRERAHQALEHASLQFKAQKGTTTSDQAIYDVSSAAMKHLGVSDAQKQRDVAGAFYNVTRMNANGG